MIGGCYTLDLRLHHLVRHIILVVLGLIQQGSEAGSARRLSERLSIEAFLLLEARRRTFLLSLTSVVDLDATS